MTGAAARREQPCKDCGQPAIRRRNDRPTYCADCAIAQQTRAAAEQHAHEGENWRKRADAMIRWADSGGIDRADAGNKWKAAKRREVNQLRTMVGELPHDMGSIAN